MHRCCESRAFADAEPPGLNKLSKEGKFARGCNLNLVEYPQVERAFEYLLAFPLDFATNV